MISGSDAWKSPPPGWRLIEGEAQLFRATLDPPLARLAQLERILSPAEHDRAARFHLDRDRRRWIAARGTLREILGSLLNENPAALDFVYGAAGKPRLARPREGAPLHFNLAHSEALAVYALATGEIGVDLEHVRPVEDAEQVGRRFFSARECDAWRALAEDQRPEGFFNCWTRKEALIKTGGHGLSDAIREVEVSLTPGEAARLISVSDGMPPPGEWTLESFRPAADYLGAVAILRNGVRVNRWSWPPEK